jgi:hypothetical protein
MKKFAISIAILFLTGAAVFAQEADTRARQVKSCITTRMAAACLYAMEYFT